MSVWTRIRDAALVALGEDTVPLTAASPFLAPSVNQEDAGYRSLNGQWDPNRDLLPLEFDASLKTADYLASRNPMGRRMVGIMRDMTLGDNVAYSLGDEATDAAKEWVDEFWEDNAMDARVARWAEGISRLGERIVPVTSDPKGRVRVGFVHPGDVKQIRWRYRDDEAAVVELKGHAGDPGDELPVIRKWREEDADRPKDADPGTYSGACFYWYVNRSEGQRRGMSDLLAFSDWLDALDELVFVGLDRAKTALHFFFDVTLEDYDEQQLLEWLSKQTPPKPGTLRAHNQLVKWELKAPELAAVEIHELLRIIKEHVLGNAGFPMHWFGSGEGANKASASEMTMPTLRMLRARRSYLVGCVKSVLEYVLDEAVRRGGLSPKDRDSVEITISIPELEDSKLGSLSSAVQAVVAAVAVAVDSGWVPDSVAQRVVQVLLSEIGVDFDPEDVQKELEAQKAEQEAAAKAAEEAAQERARQQLLEQQGKKPPGAPGGEEAPEEPALAGEE